MSQHLTDLFGTSRGAVAPLELNVLGPGCADGERRVFEHPFVLVGRHEHSCLRLEDETVSRRHAYLQQLGDRVFCVDLGSRTGIRWGGERRPAGWLRPEQGIQIGPFTLELARAAQAGGGFGDRVAEDWDPLQDRANDTQFLPRVTIERDNEVRSRFCMNRVMVLVGSSPACRIRLQDTSISRYHCSLVRTPQGVWLIDLLNGTGACLNGQSLRWALVKEGDRVQVGPYVLRVWYPEVRTETPSPSVVEIPAESPVPQEVEILRRQQEDKQAECDRLGEQVRVLEIQVAGMAGLQARLEAAEVSVRELDVLRGERDRWQAEAQDLQARLESISVEREEWQQRLEAAQQQLVGEREAVHAAGARLEQEFAALQRVQADLADRNAEHGAALQRLQETQDELALSQEETHSLQTGLAQALERQQDIEALSQQLADVQAEYAQLNARVPELEDRANSANHLCTQLQDAGSEIERLRVQLRAAESQQAELEIVRAECDGLREQARALEVQVAEMAGLQARLEAAEASVRELEVLRGERDRWQSEAQDLQARLESASAVQEQPDRLAADLHAAQMERDQLLTEQQMSQHLAEQARVQVSDLERALAEAAAAHETALEEAHSRWESERQALNDRLELEGQSRDRAVQAASRDVLARAVAEREQWRQQLECAESQLVWERGMFQEQIEQVRQQSARLQAERDRLAARLEQTELRVEAAEARAPDEARNAAEEQYLRQQAAREQVFVQLSAMRMGQLLPQTARAQRADAPVEQVHPPVPLVGLDAQSAPTAPSAVQADEGEASAQDNLPRQKDSQPEARQRLWRQILGFVLGK